MIIKQDQIKLLFSIVNLGISFNIEHLYNDF